MPVNSKASKSRRHSQALSCASPFPNHAQLYSTNACGNDVLDTGVGEECDDGNTVGGDGCGPMRPCDIRRRSLIRQ